MNQADSAAPRRAEALEIPLERDGFLRDILRVLSGTLEEIVGLEEASGFISVVGQSLGDKINAMYRQARGLERLDQSQVTEALVDLKRRIQGDFYVISEDSERIVLGNRACPFGERVSDRPSLCMMTSNVFGTLVAENLGYALVDLERTIARGDGGCRIIIHLRPPGDGDITSGREYFRGEDG
jgi:predicted ArsR family transcriptional regulator